MKTILRTWTTTLLGLMCCCSMFATDVDSLIRKSKTYLFSSPQEANYILSNLINQRELKDSLLKADILYHYGMSCNLLGSFDEAIDAFYKVLKLSPNLESPINIQANMQISGVYSSLGDYNKAFEYNDKALSFAKVINDSILIASCHNNRGLIHCNLSEFVTADNSFLSALFINRKLGNIKAIAANLNNMCLYPGNSEAKLKYINEAIIINKNLNAHWSICENLNNKAKQLYYLKRYNEALTVLKNVQEKIKKLGAKELECDNYEYLSWVYSSMGDYKQAYIYINKYLTLYNEMQDDHRLRNVEQSLSSKLMLEKEQNLEIAHHKLRINSLQRNLIILVAIIIIIVTSLLIIPKWLKKKKTLELVNAKLRLEKSERELTELKLSQQQKRISNFEDNLVRLNHQLTSYSLFINNRNEILSIIQDKLKALNRLSDSKIKPELKSIILFIKQCQSNNSNDDTFLQDIDDLSKLYLEKLLLKHPNLTKGESKLATLLRVDLSSKEIALLLGVNTNSVTMSKYRLKKSLKLSKDEDVVSYLRSI